MFILKAFSTVEKAKKIGFWTTEKSENNKAGTLRGVGFYVRVIVDMV